MTLDLQNIDLWLSAGASVATTASVVVGWLLLIGKRIKADFDRLEAEVESAEKDARLRIEAEHARALAAETRQAEALNEYRLFAASHFATNEGVGKWSESIQSSIDRLTNRIDRYFDEHRGAG